MSKYKSAEPRLSESVEARIRAAARQYVRSGGSIFPGQNGGADSDAHIDDVMRFIGRDDSATAFSDLLAKAVPDFTQHEAISAEAWNTIINHTEAAFLFGAFVGLEFAALTFGQLATAPIVNTGRRRGRKGGAR